MKTKKLGFLFATTALLLAACGTEETNEYKSRFANEDETKVEKEVSG